MAWQQMKEVALMPAADRRPFIGAGGALSLVIAWLAAGCITVAAPGTARADECSPGMTMSQYGDCIPAVDNESNVGNDQLPPEWVQVSGGDAVDPDSPVSICQDPPPCPEGKSVLASDCECPPR
ncbi:MAG: hypothetical protein KDB71_01965 [Mycobacterium sp.]|nr:hypothetical protein [Mycobacterium sp.]